MKKTYEEFHKRFANGEQDIIINEFSGEIIKENKQYFWQESGVYNHTISLVEWVQKKLPNVKEIEIYGQTGLVSRLVPLQRTYNSLKNRKIETLNRMMLGVYAVEDGSIDTDNLEAEGMAAGKVLIYRQGSTPPKNLIPPNYDFAEIIDNELNRILVEMQTFAERFINNFKE